MNKEFNFDLKAKRIRLSDSDLVAALQSAATSHDGAYFSSETYDRMPGKRPHSSTLIGRFGSWKRAMALIGITGGREREYTAEELIRNLENVWQQIGYPPGKRKIAKLGSKISETPYKRKWGSLRAACEAVAAFHKGTITREQLLKGRGTGPSRLTVSLKDRWAVLKRDNYRCKKCGASPSNDHRVELEVDHVVPVAKGGKNSIANLQTLCRDCNQGKKDR